MQQPPSVPGFKAVARTKQATDISSGPAKQKPLTEKGASKFVNFRSAVETGKAKTEHENDKRYKRYEAFESYVLGEEASGRDKEVALCRFAAREERGLAATRRQWSTADFEAVRVLGEGSFGVVHLVRKHGSNDYYALKQIKKSGYRRKNHRERMFAERHILAEARNRWFVELHATFQDAANVYMLMDFLQGGDLIFHLERCHRFPRNVTAFYMAELIEALDTVHRHGFVHRDVKPDNIVLTSAGHLQLLDFGLCKQALQDAVVEEALPIGASRRQMCRSTVGTPQYMAPEIYISGDCDACSDIWAVGIVAYECIVGTVPFHAGQVQGTESLMIIRKKVLTYAQELPIRLQKNIQKGYLDEVSCEFLRRLICDKKQRLTAAGCRTDPFFAGLDFGRVHLCTPPIVPDVSSPEDASYFDAFDSRELPPPSTASVRSDGPLEWAHYEFDRETYEYQRPNLDVETLFAPEPKASA